MKKLVLILVLISLLSCKTQEERDYEEFTQSVAESRYVLEKYEQYIMDNSYLNMAIEGTISKDFFMKGYNNHHAEILGFSNNLDTIKSYMDKKSNDYLQYLLIDGYWYYSRDSLEKSKYELQKNRILQRLRQH